MYAIVTEKGLNDEGKMVYEVFGIKVKERRDIVSTLKYINRLGMLSVSGSLLKRVLRENERDSIITDQAARRYFRVCGTAFNWPDIDLKVMNNYSIDLASIGHGVNKLGDSYVHELYHEMLDLSRKYFAGTKKQYDKVNVTSTLLHYLKAFEAIDFEIYQATPSRKLVGSPDPMLGTYGSTSIAKSNAMALMLLTGKTTYRDLNGDEKPIILDGVARRKPNWSEEETDPSPISAIDMINPLIPTDIYNPYIENGMSRVRECPESKMYY